MKNILYMFLITFVWNYRFYRRKKFGSKHKYVLSILIKAETKFMSMTQILPTSQIFWCKIEIAEKIKYTAFSTVCDSQL